MAKPAQKMTLNEREQRIIANFAEIISARSEILSRLGKSYTDDRDIYKALGFKKNLVYEDYWTLYTRLDIAKRVIDLPVQATWREYPEIVESEDEQTPFEKAWVALSERLRIFSFFARTDKLSGLGLYGGLFIGYVSDEPLNTPALKESDVAYVRPFAEGNLNITEWENEINDPRYGLPKFYSLQVSSADTKQEISPSVHHSRIIHVADGLREDNVYGTPRLEAVYNTLKNIELVSCGSAEMFWRGALPGTIFKADKEADTTNLSNTDFTTQIENFTHKLQRTLRLQGVDVEQLAPQVVSPKDHLDAYYDQVASATGIPKRILLGSERGELASSQDMFQWNNIVEDRQRNFAEPYIIRPFIDRMIEVGVLPEPPEGYSVRWPDLNAPSEQDEAEVARVKAEALSKYVSSPGADQLIPPAVFLRKLLKFTKEEVEEMEEMVEGMMRDEERQMQEYERAEREQQPEGDEDDSQDT